ncbi:hypothetical protein NDU88_002172 [Pleurodeles waltl]|uniref:Uncharacterized protein n=1 Tax=Pleurodeles waltl TaxID=8319 RepID=A0AAV7UBK0_PLEWA|nr:hypothetical protein NDU88_002172 [Pleurodeles waltl]
MLLPPVTTTRHVNRYRLAWGPAQPLRRRQDVESRSCGTASKGARDGYFSPSGPRRSYGNRCRPAWSGLGFFGGANRTTVRTTRPSSRSRMEGTIVGEDRQQTPHRLPYERLIPQVPHPWGIDSYPPLKLGENGAFRFLLPVAFSHPG